MSIVDDILKDQEKIDQIAKPAFKSVDTNNSGLIEASELESLMKQISKDMGIPQPSKSDVDDVLKQLDKDKNGKIDYNEFKVLIVDILKSMK